MSRPPLLFPLPSRRPRAFSFMELLVAMTVLVLLVGLIAQLFSSAQKATNLEQRHLDADAQARAVLDRMAIDIGQMVKRTDVDYFLKDAARLQNGNDQLAFYSQVPGYSSGSGAQSPFSVVSYRVNNNSGSPAFQKLQRFGCGLPWSGGSMAFLPATLSGNWPAAASMADDKDNYELAGPQVFRFEYYYVLKGRTISGTAFASRLSSLPWDDRITHLSGEPDHTAVNGLQDVAAIGAVIAVIDPKAQLLVKPEELARLAAAMEDFDSAAHAAPGALEAAWQNRVNTSGLPSQVTAAIRLYRRWFYLSPSPLSTP